jgi:glyoxylase-like metal-dependent hydrolase (beta-lactamase superfamily II)
MKLYSVNTGYFKLDGGAMFGVVPKSIWNKTNPADANNMIDLAMRALLIEDGNRLILIDNGIGNKQEAKFFSYYYLSGDNSIEKSLSKLGFSTNDVTDVILSHLHFDHCGGSLQWNVDRTKCELAFKNATYWSNERHWAWASQPNKREKASFLKENILPIQESGHLKFTHEGADLFPNVSILYSNGHTDAMMHPLIQYGGKTIVYMADFLPTVGHIPLPYVMGYDTRPLITLDEKEKFFTLAAEKEYILFLEHDPVNECCLLEKTEKGVRLKNSFALSECL